MPHIPGEPDELMDEIQRAKLRREQLKLRRVDPNSEVFSAEKETERQAAAVDKANTADVIDLDSPVDLDSVVDLDSPTDQGVTSWRQGSVNDIQQVKSKNPAIAEIERISQNPVMRGLGKVFDTYDKYIAGPYRRAVFKEDPLETLAKQPYPENYGWGDAALRVGKQFGVGILSDPSLALGALSVRPRRPSSPASPEPPPGPSVPPGAPPTPSAQPGTPPLSPAPSITDLAREAQGEQLLAAQHHERQQMYHDPTVVASVRRLPTGSLTRQPFDEAPVVSEYTGSEYKTLPTGSMLKVPPEQRRMVDAPGTPETPVYPSQKGEPKERLILDSRRLHGRPEKVKDAFDLLAEKRAQQQKLYNTLLRDTPVPPEAVEEPSVLYEKTRSLLKQPEQTGPASGPVEIPGTPTGLQRDPHLREKAFLHALDVLPRLGPYTGRLRDILQYTRDYSEQGSLQNLRDYVELLKTNYGGPSLGKQMQGLDWSQPRQVFQRLLNTSVEKWGMSLAEKKALIELHVAGGDLAKVSEYAKEHLPVRDPKVQKMFQDGWQIATGRASSHPVVQSRFMITDPITGEKYPVGSESPYWPHQAINQKVKQILADEHLRKIYGSKGYADKGISYEDFKERFTTWWNDQSEGVRMRKFAGLEYKRFFDPLADANSHKRSVYDSLERMGYETDPLRMLIRHNSGALKRIAFAEHEAEIKQLMNQIGLEYGMDSKTYDWVNTLVQRAQGISRRDDAIDNMSGVMKIAQSIAYPAFLKASWKQNFLLQPNYAVLQVGLRPVLESTWRFFGGKMGYSLEQSAEAARRSGAIFPDELMKYHLPDGFWTQYAKTMQTTNWFSVSDRMTRMLSGMAEEVGFHRLAHNFWQNPTDKRWIGLLKERNINPDELYRDLAAVPKEQYTAAGMPSVPEKYILRAMQVSANKAMGRTGVHSLQSWASVDSELAHALMMLHRQVASNEGMLVNSITKAPTIGIGVKRALTFLAGAEAAGLMYNGIVNLLVGNEFDDVNKSLVEVFGGQKEAALAAKALLMGIGTLSAGLVLTGLQIAGGNKVAPAYAVFSPPIAALVDETMNKLIQGKVGEAALRLQPLETVTTISRYGEQEERRRKHAPMSPPDPLRTTR